MSDLERDTAVPGNPLNASGVSALNNSPTPLVCKDTEGLEAVKHFADVLRLYWSFDDRQHHTHSWHSREDFIERVLPDLLGVYSYMNTSPTPPMEPVAPEGDFVLVPREPTEAMRDASYDAGLLMPDDDEGVDAIWKAMIAAAPTPLIGGEREDLDQK